MKDIPSSDYYIQIVKQDEEPEWPVPESELIVGSQDLGGGFYQFWAYPEDSGKEADDIPPAEKVAGEYNQPKPAILIDQKGELLELILVKDAHAWAHSVSSLDNLEDNVSEMLDFAKRKFDFQAEHFMTTERVSGEAEEKLNALEKGEEVEEEEGSEGIAQEVRTGNNPDGKLDDGNSKIDEEVGDWKLDNQPSNFKHHIPASNLQHLTSESEPTEVLAEESAQDQWSIRQVKSHPPSLMPHAGRPAVHQTPQRRGRNALTVLLPILLIGAVFAGLMLSKEQILGKLRGQGAPVPEAQVTLSPSPLPTAIPTQSMDRSSVKVRVLNGTTKTGAAAVLGEKLESLGWEVLSVGNAPKKGVERTIVRVKKEGGQIPETLVSDLASIYNATTTADLKDNDKADAEVVIGLK